MSNSIDKISKNSKDFFNDSLSEKSIKFIKEVLDESKKIKNPPKDNDSIENIELPKDNNDLQNLNFIDLNISNDKIQENNYISKPPSRIDAVREGKKMESKEERKIPKEIKTIQPTKEKRKVTNESKNKEKIFQKIGPYKSQNPDPKNNLLPKEIEINPPISEINPVQANIIDFPVISEEEKKFVINTEKEEEEIFKFRKNNKIIQPSLNVKNLENGKAIKDNLNNLKEFGKITQPFDNEINLEKEKSIKGNLNKLKEFDKILQPFENENYFEKEKIIKDNLINLKEFDKISHNQFSNDEIQVEDMQISKQNIVKEDIKTNISKIESHAIKEIDSQIPIKNLDQDLQFSNDNISNYNLQISKGNVSKNSINFSREYSDINFPQFSKDSIRQDNLQLNYSNLSNNSFKPGEIKYGEDNQFSKSNISKDNLQMSKIAFSNNSFQFSVNNIDQPQFSNRSIVHDDMQVSQDLSGINRFKLQRKDIRGENYQFSNADLTGNNLQLSNFNVTNYNDQTADSYDENGESYSRYDYLNMSDDELIEKGFQWMIFNPKNLKFPPFSLVIKLEKAAKLYLENRIDEEYLYKLFNVEMSKPLPIITKHIFESKIESLVTSSDFGLIYVKKTKAFLIINRELPEMRPELFLTVLQKLFKYYPDYLIRELVKKKCLFGYTFFSCLFFPNITPLETNKKKLQIVKIIKI